MHDSDSFISEVSEEVRKDRLYAVLRRWGWLIGAVLLLIVAGAAGNEWRKGRAEARAEAAGDALRTAYRETDPARRAERLEALAAGTAGGPPLPTIAAAAARFEAGETEAAAALLAAVAARGDLPAAWRDLAALQRVMMLGAGMDASERLATLETLVADGAPYRLLALEQRALVRIEAGDLAAARADLAAISADPGASQALAARADQLALAIGADAADAPPADG